MAITNRYRLGGRPFERPCEGEDAPVRKLFFLSVEGDLMEKHYFDHLNTWLRESGISSVMIHVLLHPKDGCNSPRYVYDLLAECREVVGDAILPLDAVKMLSAQFSEEEIEKMLLDAKGVSGEKLHLFHQTLSKLGIDCDYRKFLSSIGNDTSEDVFAVVFDRDKDTHNVDDIREIIDLCAKSKMECYISNPCFEFWLALHLFSVDELKAPEEYLQILENSKITNRHTYISKKVSEKAGHNKEITYGKFVSVYSGFIKDAIERAKEFPYDVEKLLDNVGTNVHVLVQQILECHK